MKDIKVALLPEEAEAWQETKREEDICQVEEGLVPKEGGSSAPGTIGTPGPEGHAGTPVIGGEETGILVTEGEENHL